MLKVKQMFKVKRVLKNYAESGPYIHLRKIQNDFESNLIWGKSCRPYSFLNEVHIRILLKYVFNTEPAVALNGNKPCMVVKTLWAKFPEGIKWHNFTNFLI